MTLLNAIMTLDELPEEATIYALEPWLPESKVVVLTEPDGGGLPQEAEDAGLSYFLEVAIAREFLEDWQASLSSPVTSAQQCARLIQYALNDA